MTDLSQVDLKKQTVAQLTTLCREHKLSCYSKLKKAALIEKLETHRDRAQASVSIVAPSNPQPSIVVSEDRQLHPGPEIVLPRVVDSPLAPASKAMQPVPSNPSAQINRKENGLHPKNASESLNIPSSRPLPTTVTGGSPHQSLATPLSQSTSNLVLPFANIFKPKPVVTSKVLPEKRSIEHVPESLPRAPKKRLPNPTIDERASKASFLTLKRHAAPVRAAQTVLRAPDVVTQQTLPRDLPDTAKRRFVPLKSKLPTTQKPVIPSVVPSLTSSPAGIFQPYLVQRDYDLPLSNITIPPSLSQRKRVKSLGLILRDLSDASRRSCCLASRTLRYAVYVSAQFVLCVEFPGKRTDSLLSRAHDCFTNLWPYLTFRRQEKARLKRLYESCFLSRYAPNPILERVWGNPDRGDEVSLALRFTLSRLWFTLSLLGDSGRHFLKESVLNLTRLAGDEVWQITVQTEEEGSYTLFVLGLTGEPIGCQSKGQGMSRFVRSDWRQYMDSATSAASAAKSSLTENLRCANEEEYVKGISKVWMQKIEREGDAGTTKRRVAERYVMASVVANSVSGKQMSHLQMAMQTAGIPPDGANRVRSYSQVNLFLSEHHHVESVQFTSSSGRQFHPAVASIQTPHREYFVLRENGLQIGCEEEGVSETWMEVLGVLRDGSPCS